MYVGEGVYTDVHGLKMVCLYIWGFHISVCQEMFNECNLFEIQELLMDDLFLSSMFIMSSVWVSVFIVSSEVFTILLHSPLIVHLNSSMSLDILCC